ncbi:hypothetical protein M501DRAFT_1012654 [Patellaria atrata CBS 101060]|uniref:Uncharacterized protein n=1 Tax=Patellaria atrata CBS 101060 TaxID=1346257 RepID=A0A9P4VVQ5_9PEZI|nr:hypothetical protein M501DRAFT_1012654 [Patellaria atrata CBS 101060]
MHSTSSEIERNASNLIENLATEAVGTAAADSWYCIVACAFAACNQGTLVARVYQRAISSYMDDADDRKRILHRIKESIIKVTVIFGIPRGINAIRSIIKVIPPGDEYDNTKSRKEMIDPVVEYDRGLRYMRNIFREDLDPFLDTMELHSRDLKEMVVDYIYGHLQSNLDVIDAITTSQLNIVSLIPMDVMTEVAWHMRGLIRNGGSVNQIQYVLDTVDRICKVTEVQLRNELPTVDLVIDAERLF